MLTILDTYGPRVCGIIGSCLLVIGSLLFVFAQCMHAPLAFDPYIAGYLFLALGGPFVYISSFHLSNTFPAHSGMILSMLTAAFAASSAVFLIFRLTNEYTDGFFSTLHFFLIYLTVPLFILAAQVTVIPATSYKTVGELVLQAESHIAAHDANESAYQRIHHQEIVNIRRQTPVLDRLHSHSQSQTTRQQNTDNIYGTLHGLSSIHQILTPWFILYALFTTLQTLRMNYFIASISQQYEFLLHSASLARHLRQTLNIALPLGGTITAPFTNTIPNTFSTTSILTILISTTTTLGILGCIPHSLVVGYANIALFGITRPFIYSALSDYATRVFGFRNFGKVYGLVIVLSGMGGFAQVALDVVTWKVCRGSGVC